MSDIDTDLRIRNLQIQIELLSEEIKLLRKRDDLILKIINIDKELSR